MMYIFISVAAVIGAELFTKIVEWIYGSYSDPDYVQISDWRRKEKEI